MSLTDIAIAYDKGEITRDQMRWSLLSNEKREHFIKQYETDVSPQRIATIMINDWEPVCIRNNIAIDDVPAWTIREGINRYIDDTISKANMIKLFEYLARRVVEAREMTAEELVDRLIERQNETPEERKQRIKNG